MKKILLVCFSFALVFNVWAQDRNVSGKVTSAEDGSALPGVSVLLKGTTVGTVTDADGNYKITVAGSGGTLVFSFIGMTGSEVEIGDRSVVDVSLGLDVKQLSEIVVTAGGVEQSKKSLGYAIQTVNANDLIESRQSNLINALNSKSAGVSVVSSAGTPGASAQIRIRGGSSISRSNDPLFVIDGIPVDNSSTDNGVAGVNQSNRLIDINPNDIETMTILKGPAATVQYGIRGSNGVVIVTTKKGRNKQKASINFSTTTTVDEVNKLPEMQLSWAQGRNGVYQDPSSGQATSWGPAISTLRLVPDASYIYDRNGKLVGQANAPAGSLPARAYDNVGTFFQRGLTQDHYVSASAGSEKSTIFASAGYLKQTGIIPLSDFERYTFKLNAETSITEKLKVGAGVTYTQSGGRRIQQGSNLSGLMLGLLRTPPTFDNSNGLSDPANNPDSYRYANVSSTDQDNYQRSYRFNYDNPYWTVNNSPFRDKVDRTIGNINFVYSVKPWLKLTARSGIDFFTDFRKESFDIGSKTTQAGQSITNQITNQQINHDLFLNLEKDLGSSFNLFATLGYNYFGFDRNRNEQNSTTATIPGFFDPSNYSTTVPRNFTTRRQIHGAYGEARLTWKDIVFLNFSARNDWSSTLPKANNAIFYPSASLGIDLTQAFLTDVKQLTFWKIRGSYGTVGNDAPIYSTDNYFIPFRFADGWTDGLTAPIRGQNAFVSNGILGNSKLRPELTTTIEVGTDVTLFDGRLTLDYTYFKTENKDQILPAQIAASSGFYQTIVNTGLINRSGHEIVLTGKIIKSTSGFGWDASVNFTQYRAEVKELFGDLDRTQAGFNGFVNYAVKGKAFPTFYGTRFQRNAAGKVIVGADGLPIQASTDAPLGSPIPDWQAGIRNSFSYKNITLSALLDIRQGGDVWNGTKGVTRGFGTSKDTEDRTTATIFPNSVFEDGTPNNVPIILGGQTYNRNYGFTGLDELNIEDGSWVRLREVSLSYTFPTNLLEKTKFVKKASLALTARNLFLSTKYSGIDPETNLTGASNDFGEDYFNMPNTKSYGFNLTVSF